MKVIFGGFLLEVILEEGKLHILKKQSVSEATIIIIVMTFLSKVVGYFREMLVANYFGATTQTDAFLIAMIIPSMVLGLIGISLQIAVIPVYIEKKKKSLKNGQIFINQIFIISFIILVCLSFVLFVFPTFFIKFIAYGFKEERLYLAAHFMRYLIVFGFFNVLGYFLMGIYQSEKQFLYPAVVVFIGNSLIPLSLFLFISYIGINSWIVGEISFALFTFFALFFVLWWKRGFFRYLNISNIDWYELRLFGVLLLPIIFTSGIDELNQIVDKVIASSLVGGSIAIQNFANRIYLIPLGVIGLSVVTAVYPKFSYLAAERDHKNYVDNFRKTIIFIMYLMIPISTIFVILSQPIVRILFQHGAFDIKATKITAFTLSMYSIGLFFLAANEFLRRIFFSFKDTKSILNLTSIIVAINIVLSVTLSRILGVGGIALATSIAATIGFFLYNYALKKRGYIKGITYTPLLKELVKILSISLFIGLLSAIFSPFINDASTFIFSFLRFLLVILILVGVYLFLSFIFKLDGYNMFVFYIKKIFSKIKEK
jgi:putative peptidoglycan lipid II flippase